MTDDDPLMTNPDRKTGFIEPISSLVGRRKRINNPAGTVLFAGTYGPVTMASNYLRSTLSIVLRQNSMRTENGAILCHDGCLIQVIPSPSNAKNLSR
jgi:hypothetical protein